jgi:hypothetical protein
MLRHFIPGGLLLAALLLAGCTTPGGRLEPHVTDQIQPGVTTRAEVERLLGKPGSTASGAGGRAVTGYAYRTTGSAEDSSATGMQIRLRTLSVLYGPDDVVLRKHLAEGRSSYRPGFFTPSEVGKPAAPETLAAVMVPGTPREQVVAALGVPTAEMLTLEGHLALVWAAARQRSGMDERWREQLVTAEFDVDDRLVKHVVTGTLEPRGAAR